MTKQQRYNPHLNTIPLLILHYTHGYEKPGYFYSLCHCYWHSSDPSFQETLRQAMEQYSSEGAFNLLPSAPEVVAHDVPDVCWCSTTATSNYVDQTIQSKIL